MTRTIVATLTGLAIALALAVPHAPSEAAEVKSLRGGIAIPNAPKRVDRPYKLDVPDEPFARAYKQQPPLINHKVAKYRINLKENRCMRCHDKANHKKEEAPMAGKSHYIGAGGKEMQNISGSRYFCTQCHVPQRDAKPLVENIFKGTPQK